MKEIITWLRSVELLAGNVYLHAADRMVDDQKFSSFLARLSEEESWHYHIIGSAARYFEENDIQHKSAILIDEKTKREIEAPFHELAGRLARKELTRQDVFDCMIQAEFAELNFVFLYVVNTLSKTSFAFQHVAATIEAHKNRIIEFIEELSEQVKVPNRLYKLPKLWDIKILVVEDEEPVRHLFSGILSMLGKVETSAYGQDGLEKIKSSFYDAIISDINMPGMNGIDLYTKAVEINPYIYHKFLFVSGLITPEIREFLETNHLLWLEKPFNLKKLLGLVQEIIKKTS